MNTAAILREVADCADKFDCLPSSSLRSIADILRERATELERAASPAPTPTCSEFRGNGVFCIDCNQQQHYHTIPTPSPAAPQGGDEAMRANWTAADFRDGKPAPKAPTEGAAVETTPKGIVSATLAEFGLEDFSNYPKVSRGFLVTLVERAHAHGARGQQMPEETGRSIEAELRAEWGGDYERKMEISRQVAKAYGGEVTLTALEEKLGGAEMIRMFARIGEAVGSIGTIDTATADDAKSEIRRLQGEAFRDPNHPLMDKLHPEHQALVRKMNQLYAAAYGR